MFTHTPSTQNARILSKMLLVASLEPHEIGQRLKQARQAKHWTQLEFALEAGVSPATIQRWEAGKLPRVRELLRIADILEVPAEELVEPEVSERDEETAARLDRIERAQGRTNALLRELIARQRPDDEKDRARTE